MENAFDSCRQRRKGMRRKRERDEQSEKSQKGKVTRYANMLYPQSLRG